MFNLCKAFDQKGSLEKHNAAVHEEKKTLKIKPKNGHSRIKHYSREVKEEGKWPQSCKVFSRIFYCLTCDKECCLERDFDKDKKQALKRHDKKAHKCSKCTKKK